VVHLGTVLAKEKKITGGIKLRLLLFVFGTVSPISLAPATPNYEVVGG